MKWVKKAWRRVERLYWSIVPYHWRPGQLWYAFKCWAWKRHSTVKPRWLGHGWVDRSYLLPCLMFEVLGQFLEKECGDDSPVNWDTKEDDRKAIAEMRELWRWWTEEYLKFDTEKFFQAVERPTHVKGPTETLPDGTEFYTSNLKFSSLKADETYMAAVRASADAEVEMENELLARCKRLIDVMPFMWT